MTSTKKTLAPNGAFIFSCQLQMVYLMSNVIYEIEYYETNAPLTPCHKFFDNLYSTCDFAAKVRANQFRTYNLACTQYLVSGSTLI